MRPVGRSSAAAAHLQGRSVRSPAAWFCAALAIGLAALASVPLTGPAGAASPAIVVVPGAVDLVASSHAQYAEIPISLSAPTPSPLDVHWTVVGGTAVVGRDVAAGSGTVHFSGSTTEQFVQERVLPAGPVPSSACWYQGGSCLTYSLKLSVVSGTATIDDGRWTDSIVFPASSKGTSLGAGDALVWLAAGQPSAQVKIPVTLTSASKSAVTVKYQTEAASAQPGLQYVTAHGTLRLPAGTTTAYVTVSVVTKHFAQPFEVFTLHLSSPSGASMTRPTGDAILSTPGVGVASPISSGYGSATLTQMLSSSGVGDTYAISATATSSSVLASSHIAQGNDRVVYFPAGEPQVSNEQSCATWTVQSPTQQQGSSIQEGLALRVATDDGVTRAITVTKNIYGRYYNQINVHTWSTAQWPPFHYVGGLNIGPYLASSKGQNLPLNICARVVGSSLQLETWVAGSTPPAWGTPRQGVTVQLPSGWGYPGSVGWYAGHFPSNGALNYSNEYEGAPTSTPVI